MGEMWQSRDDHDEEDDDDDAARLSDVRGSSDRVLRQRRRLWLPCSCSLDDDVDVGRSFSRWAVARLDDDGGAAVASGLVVVASAWIGT
jgi:hypothetical protein